MMAKSRIEVVWAIGKTATRRQRHITIPGSANFRNRLLQPPSSLEEGWAVVRIPNFEVDNGLEAAPFIAKPLQSRRNIPTFW
jgi:hypothetical protein